MRRHNLEKYQKHGHMGETNTKWESRENEQEDKVRFTKRDVEAGDLENTSRRMKEGDGGLARHSTMCFNDRLRLSSTKNLF